MPTDTGGETRANSCRRSSVRLAFAYEPRRPRTASCTGSGPSRLTETKTALLWLAATTLLSIGTRSICPLVVSVISSARGNDTKKRRIFSNSGLSVGSPPLMLIQHGLEGNAAQSSATSATVRNWLDRPQIEQIWQRRLQLSETSNVSL